MPLISIVIAVHNAKDTIRQVVDSIQGAAVDKEIIVVDSASSDGTDKILRDMPLHNLKVIHHTTNRGKCAAFLTGLNNASGEFVMLRDPEAGCAEVDYLGLINQINSGSADIIFGAASSVKRRGLIPGLKCLFAAGLLRVLSGVKLKSRHHCYKLARKATFEALDCKPGGPSMDTRIIARAAKSRLRIKEV